MNCGFVLSEINEEAIRVIRNFCLRTGLRWRFAIAIACGPAVIMTKFIDFKLKMAFRAVAADIENDGPGQKEDIFIKPILPRIIMDTVRQRMDRNALKKSV